jgi:hypothetical protein
VVNYLPTNTTDDMIVYEFNDATLISAYNNAPNYNVIKNDIVVWGVRGDSV